MIQVVRSLQTHHGINGKSSKVILIVSYEFGAERSARNSQKVLAKLSVVTAVVDGGRFQRLAGSLASKAPSLGDSLGVNALVDEIFSLTPGSAKYYLTMMRMCMSNENGRILEMR